MRAIPRLRPRTGKVERASLQVQSGGLRGRQGLEVFDHAPETERFIVKRSDRLLGGIRQAVEDRFGVGLQDSDRCAQLVGDVSDQGVSQAVLSLEGFGHRVKSAAQIPQLARPASRAIRALPSSPPVRLPLPKDA